MFWLLHDTTMRLPVPNNLTPEYLLETAQRNFLARRPTPFLTNVFFLTHWSSYEHRGYSP